ncbi:MAG: tetraspanin family protein [Gemmatimonadetes bacterium]|nr:tetraspanin family protein [Gemmatimonadota bacterium]
MSDRDAPRPAPLTSPTTLSWPPPGLERLQGSLWRAILITWVGSLVLVLPLLWALAVEQPFYSLGPFEENWELGLGIAVLGAVIIVVGFGLCFGLMRTAAKAADLGYGTLTIVTSRSSATMPRRRRGSADRRSDTPRAGSRTRTSSRTRSPRRSRATC